MDKLIKNDQPLAHYNIYVYYLVHEHEIPQRFFR